MKKKVSKKVINAIFDRIMKHVEEEAKFNGSELSSKTDMFHIIEYERFQALDLYRDRNKVNHKKVISHFNEHLVCVYDPINEEIAGEGWFFILDKRTQVESGIDELSSTIDSMIEEHCDRLGSCVRIFTVRRRDRAASALCYYSVDLLNACYRGIMSGEDVIYNTDEQVSIALPSIGYYRTETQKQILAMQLAREITEKFYESKPHSMGQD
jgi:hypothetical protein